MDIVLYISTDWASGLWFVHSVDGKTSEEKIGFHLTVLLLITVLSATNSGVIFGRDY
jgi:hypothetical protein